MASNYSKYATYTKPSTPTPAVPLTPGIDTEHLTPTDNPEVSAGQPLWQSNSGAPILPDELAGSLGGSPIGGGGPLDETPLDHEDGLGAGPGYNREENQYLAGIAHAEDRGSVAVNSYHPMTDRDENPRLFVIHDPIGEGDSPRTVELQRTGYGMPNDPGARRGKRQSRLWNRIWDMHWFQPEYRAMKYRNAYTAQTQEAVPDGNQYNSPFPTAASGYREFGSPDSFISPQTRRTPGQWDAPLESDATVAQQPFGLTNWGL